LASEFYNTFFKAFQHYRMEQSQLIELIKTLSPAERSGILQFATISFFNNGRMRAHVCPLLELCFNRSWDDPEQRLEKIDVFASVFPGQDYVDGKLEKVMVEAHKVIRSFLLAQRYFDEEKEFQQLFDFAEIVRIRSLQARYQQLITRLNKIQEESEWKNIQFYQRQFLLEYAKHDEESLYNQKKGDLNIPNTLFALEMHHHLHRLALTTRFLLQQKFANLEVPDSIQALLEVDSLDEKYLNASPFALVTNKIFLLLRKRHPDPNDAQELFDLLILHEKCFSEENLREFYTYLRNICVLVLKSNPDYEEIHIVLHELYKDNLQRGFLHYEGKLHPSRHMGIFDNALRIKDFNWALAFLEKYKNDIIGENETHDIYRFNKAQYLFAIGQYDECLSIIPATSTFVDYMVSGKRLELKAYYELQSDLLPYKLDAFKMFISRTSQKLLSDSLIKTNSEFANLLYQLMTSIPGDKKRADLLIERIEKKKQALEWRWLLAKAHALKGN
jgi:hypothetical protein